MTGSESMALLSRNMRSVYSLQSSASSLKQRRPPAPRLQLKPGESGTCLRKNRGSSHKKGTKTRKSFCLLCLFVADPSRLTQGRNRGDITSLKEVLLI